MAEKHDIPVVLLMAVAFVAVFAGMRGGGTQSHHTYSRAANRKTAKSPAAAMAAAPPCPDVEALQLFQLLDGVDTCVRKMTPAEIAKLNDPFAVNVLRKGIGQATLWPTSVEQIGQLIDADPAFKSNQKSYMVGEGGQIPASIAPRDANRNLRYVVTWGATATPTIFLSALPSGTHPGQPAPFLQVIGYDQASNVFNYYQFTGNEGQPTRTWSWAGSSPGSRDPATAGRGCFQCHINGALNMKELTPPWNNWSSARANIASSVIPAAVASDPLFTGLKTADILQNNFQSLQSRYTSTLVQSHIAADGTIAEPPVLLRRLIETTTVNFGASSATPLNAADVVVPVNFFLFQDALTMPQIGLSFTGATSITIPRKAHDAFVKAHRFKLVQNDATPPFSQSGTTFFAAFVPLPAFEDTVAIRELLNQKVIDANFAASVLMVDFANPVFSAKRASLMTYAGKIASAHLAGAPDDISTQFTALVQAAAKGQPPCNPAKLFACTAEQQYLFFAGQSDWKQRAAAQINPYLAAVSSRIGTTAGANDYMRLMLSRQAQFAADPRVGNLDEFLLLLPQTDQSFANCLQMNVDGTVSPNPQSKCM